MHVFHLYRMNHTCSDDLSFTLRAVARSSLSRDEQDVHFSTRQIADVTASVRCGATGGASIYLLQRGLVRNCTRNGRP